MNPWLVGFIIWWIVCGPLIAGALYDAYTERQRKRRRYDQSQIR